MALATDTDPNSNTLTVTAVGTPTDGSASIGSGGGYVVYTPPDGTYAFGYMISDGAGGTASSAVTAYVDSLEGCCTTIALYPHNQRLKAPVAGSLSPVWLPCPFLAVVGRRVLTEPSKSFKSVRGEIAGSTAMREQADELGSLFYKVEHQSLAAHPTRYGTMLHGPPGRRTAEATEGAWANSAPGGSLVRAERNHGLRMGNGAIVHT